MHKKILIAIGVLFGLFAILQWNDPDPWAWVLLYGSTALIAILTAFELFPRLATLAAAAVTTWQLIVLFPEIGNWFNAGTPSITGQMSAENPQVEFVREFFGLFLNLIALVYIFIQGRRVMLNKFN